MLALIDPFSGVAGDMLLGALVDVGLEQAFIEKLPSTLGLDGVGVRVARTQRCGISAMKVDFDIPPQPHGRHLKHILETVDRAPVPASVKAAASDAFRLIATTEAEIHGTTVERVHLHEVGAVDAILDIVGAVWGFAELGITDIRCGTIALGDGTVNAAHGAMPVPAPATARLVEGLAVRVGPADSGELTTPTGAVLVRVLARGAPPDAYITRRTGYGAGTREFADRPNVLRVTLADAAPATARERLVQLAADIDDDTPEHIAAAAEQLRADGALDVTLSSIVMKKGRLGTRIEVLSTSEMADRLEQRLFATTSTIGVRRASLERHALERAMASVNVLGHTVRVKAVSLPDGTSRAKPESDDVQRVAAATGRAVNEIVMLAISAARPLGDSV